MFRKKKTFNPPTIPYNHETAHEWTLWAISLLRECHPRPSPVIQVPAPVHAPTLFATNFPTLLACTSDHPNVVEPQVLNAKLPLLFRRTTKRIPRNYTDVRRTLVFAPFLLRTVRSKVAPWSADQMYEQPILFETKCLLSQVVPKHILDENVCLTRNKIQPDVSILLPISTEPYAAGTRARIRAPSAMDIPPHSDPLQPPFLPLSTPIHPGQPIPANRFLL